jgi:Tfp pilus assembly protein PilF
VAGAVGLGLLLRLLVVGSPGPSTLDGNDLTGSPVAGTSFGARLPVALSLPAWYLRMTFWPDRLLVFDRPPDLPGWADPGVWIGAALLAGVTGGCVSAALRRHPSLPGLFWWLSGFLIVGQLITPIGTLREARLAYALLGAAALAIAPLVPPARSPRQETAVRLLLGALLVVGSFLSWKRNGEFASETALFEREVSRNPRGALAHLALGGLQMNAGRITEAARSIEAAAALAPRSSQALTDLGALRLETGDTARAETLLRSALELAPGSDKALMTLGVLRLRQQRLDEAYDLLGRSERANPASFPTQLNLALIEAMRGESARALRRIETFEARAPDPAMAAPLRALIR